MTPSPPTDFVSSTVREDAPLREFDEYNLIPSPDEDFLSFRAREIAERFASGVREIRPAKRAISRFHDPRGRRRVTNHSYGLTTIPDRRDAGNRKEEAANEPGIAPRGFRDPWLGIG